MRKILLSIFIPILLFSCEKPAPEVKQEENKMPTNEEIKLINQAVPDAPTAKPLKPRKILVFSLAWGYKHSAVPWGIEAIKAMVAKSRAFDIVVSNDIYQFEAENLKQFDAVVFNNTNQEIFLPENYQELSPEEQNKAATIDNRLKENFVNYLKSGKGLAVIHAGLASFRDWPEFGKIIGARFDNHPWVSGSTITVKVDEPGHALNKAFKNTYFEVKDEIYQMTGDYSRDNLRILLSIDTDRTDMTKESIHRTDGDFALSWIKGYGQGRVFYFAFGHDKEIYWTTSLLKHLQDGIQFVTGDLVCDSRPSSMVNGQ